MQRAAASHVSSIPTIIVKANKLARPHSR